MATVINKEKLNLGEEKPLILLNLSLPFVQGDSPVSKSVTAYSDALKNGILSFANKKLLVKAKKESAEEAFKPYGVVLQTVISYETEKVLSLYTDGVITASGARRVYRIARLWHKEKGTILPFNSLFNKAKRLLPLLTSAADEYSQTTPLYADAEKQIKSRFRTEQFYLCPKGAVFYFQAGELTKGEKPVPLYIDREELSPFMTEEAKLLLCDG